MLLLLGGRRLARAHLHLHSSRKELWLLLLLLRLLLMRRLLYLVLWWVSLVDCGAGLRHHVVLQGLGRTCIHLVVRVVARCSSFRLLLVVMVELLDVQAASTLVQMHLPVDRALDLDRLSTVALLSIELASVQRIDVKHITLMVLTGRSVGRGDNCLTRWIVAKVCLIHKLLVERRIHRCVIVLDRLLMVRYPGLVHLGTVFEQLVENRLLLVCLDAHAFALDSTALREK